MSDIFQAGDITTLHRLGDGGVSRIEKDLRGFVNNAPIALLLPCHVRDLATLGKIAIELRRVRYLREIFVGLDGATSRTEVVKARRMFAGVRAGTHVIWNDGPRMRRLQRSLLDAGIEVGSEGKGRNVWMCVGGALAFGQARIIAVHDCDVLNYDRELLARLCHPIADPAPGFDFCKGYYARFNSRLHGRVMRLLVVPLLRVLRDALGNHPLLGFLGEFRYPLSGEFALRASLAKRLPMHGDWSFDLGLLVEVFRNCGSRSVCQSDLCENYDHKHQQLSPRSPTHGLHQMAADIVRSLFHRLSGDGVSTGTTFRRKIHHAYLCKATEFLRSFAADAAINGLEFPHAEEKSAVAVFARCILKAPSAATTPIIPDWESTQSILPDILPRLREAIAADNAVVPTKSAA